MGIGTAVAGAVIRWAERRAASSAPRVGASWMEGQTVFSEWSTERAIREGYKAHYALYAVASDLADCIRAVPWVLKRQGRTGAEMVDSHLLVNLLRSPNPDQPWGALTEAWDLYKSLAGNAYGRIVVVRDKLDVWSLRPDRVTVIPDKLGHVLRYEYSVEGQAGKLRPEEVLHFKFFDPGDDHYGLAPLQAAARIVDTSTAAIGWNKDSMGNRARPDLLLSPKSPLTPLQHKTLLELLSAQVQGPKNAHRALIPSEPLDISQLSLSPAEMDFLNSLVMYERAIFKVFHVHPDAIGDAGSTFENKRWAIRAKWEGPVTSRLREMRAVLNHKLAPWGTAYPPAPGDLFLDYDLSDTPAVSEARKERSEEAMRYFGMGFSVQAVNEKLGLGFDPDDVPDDGYLSVGLLPVSGGTRPAGRAVRTFNLKTPAQFEAHWRAVDRRKQGWERGVSRKIGAQFKADKAAVLSAVEAGAIDLEPVIAGQTQAWTGLVGTILRAVVEDFGKKTHTEILGDRSRSRETRVFDAWNQATQKWAAEKAAEDVTSIQDTTKQALRKDILDGLDQNETMGQIAKRVEATMDSWGEDVDRGRAMVIARTEVHAAAGYGSHEGARQSGVADEKAWLSSMDPPRAREDHMILSGNWIPFDEPFRMPDGTEMDFPGDGPPDHVINCRCVCMYRVAGGQ